MPKLCHGGQPCELYQNVSTFLDRPKSRKLRQLRALHIIMSKALCSSRCLIQAAKFYSPPLPLFPLSLLFHQHASFSTTFPLAVRKRKGYAKRRHNNPHRGESALRRTGLSHAVGMSKEPLPVPVLDPRKRTKVVADPKHGLWGFFNEKKELLTPPDQELRHGRAWTVNELRSKSWEDLHALWYTCIKEHNRMATEEYERKRMQLRVGEWEANERTRVVWKKLIPFSTCSCSDNCILREPIFMALQPDPEDPEEHQTGSHRAMVRLGSGMEDCRDGSRSRSQCGSKCGCI